MVVDQSLMQDLVLEAVSIASVELMVELVDLLSTKNMYCYEVAEFAVIASTSSRDVNLSLAVLNLWVKRKNYKTYSPLDVVAISLEASAAPCTKSPFSRQARNVSSLAETAIYVAAVDKFSDVLKTILAWVAENREEV